MEYYRKTNELHSFENILKGLEMNENQYYEALRCSFKRIEIVYKRESNAIGVNTYNRTLLDTLESNHDIQYIPEPYGFVNYLLSYVLKTDEGVLDMMKKAEEECRAGNKTLPETLSKVSSAFHNSSYIYGQQAVEEIEGFAVLNFSHIERFLNTGRPEKRVGIRKSMKDLKEMDDDDDNIILPDFLNEYANRPKELEHVCWMVFGALYKRKGERETESDDEENDDDGNNAQKTKSSAEYVLRAKERIIRWVGFKKEINDKEHRRELRMLGYPWRNEKEELLDQSKVDEVFANHYEEILRNYARFNSLSFEELERLQKEVEEQLKPYVDEEINEFQQMENEAAFIPKIDVFQELGIDINEKSEHSKRDTGAYSLTRPAKIDKQELFEDMRKLNERQQEFVQHVFHTIKTKTEHESFPKILLLGPAGTGKSLVLRTLNQLITHYYNNIRGENPDEPKVCLAAYTGIAAFLIGGNTCHHAFALQIGYKGKSLTSDSTKNTIRTAHRAVKAIIIDELSFISKQNRNDIDLNCRKIYGNDDESFGGKLVIFMGDLFQLPPVCGQPIYRTMKNTNSKQTSKGRNLMANIESDRVWNEFKLFELTEIVRQKHATYQTALNNLARGKMTEADLKLINERVFARDEDIPPDVIHLFYSNEEVRSYNAKKIYALGGEVYEVDATDEIKGDKVLPEIKEMLLKDYLQDKIPSNNLKQKLLVKIGIRYMVLYNIDVSDGLVNGAFGILELITFSEKNNKEVLLMWLNFNNSRVGNVTKMPYIDYMKANNIPLNLVPIKKETLDMTCSKKGLLSNKVLHEAFRTQFPVTPCEALTIHKTQGLTLPNICLDLRKVTRGLVTNLKYVALSRCDFQGLYILGEFKCPTDNSSIGIIEEIERLRKEAPLELCFYNFEQDTGKKIIYHNVCSFATHKDDIKAINWYWKADVLIFSESNTLSVISNDIRNNFTILYPTFKDAFDPKGRSKGLILLCLFQVHWACTNCR